MKISVVIPTYNRAKYLIEALSSLERQDFFVSDFEVLVIDDGSSDETEKVVKNFISPRHSRPLCHPRAGGDPDSPSPYPRGGLGRGQNMDPGPACRQAGIRLRQLADGEFRDDNTKKKEEKRALDIKYFRQAHQGVSVARNLGARQAQSEIIVFFDDDAVAAKNWLTNIARIMERENVITGSVRPLKHAFWQYFAPHYFQGDTPCESPVLLEGNCAIKKQVFEKIGYFDTALDYGHEGREFIERVKKYFSVKYYPEMVIYHDYALGLANYFWKQWRFGEKEAYLRSKNAGQPTDQAKNIFPRVPAPWYFILLVKIVARCGRLAHWLGENKSKVHKVHKVES